MFKNYLKVALRSIQRNKMFSALNILGLSIGLASTILIIMWVLNEKSWDSEYKDHDKIYQVMGNRNFNGEIVTASDVMFPLAKAVKASLPEVRSATVTSIEEERLITYGDKAIRFQTITASEGFFDVFTLKFLKGSGTNVLGEPNTIVLSTTAARTLFGKEEPLNKTVKINNTTDAKVVGVTQDLPQNSTMQFSAVLPFNYADSWIRKSQSDWINSFFRVYLKSETPLSEDFFNSKITNLVRENNPENTASFFVHPMSKWHLYSEFKDGKNTGGMIDYVNLFIVVAIIILVIACVNFMNLSTARSNKRAKEVGIRKTLGSDRSRLLLQFLTESIVMAILAFLVAICMVYLALPYFNDLVKQQLEFNPAKPSFLIAGLLISLLTGLVSGSYPAFFLSSFAPVKVLKGVVRMGKNAIQPRKVLVTAQFVISILLISATIIVYQQLNHVKNRHLGYNPDNLIMVRSSTNINKNFKAIRDELQKTGMIESASRSTSPVTNIYNYTAGLEWKGMSAEKNLVIAAIAADEDFFKTINTRMTEGREFSGDFPSDTSALILNRSAVEAMGITNPVGTIIRYNKRNFEVVGVSENIVMSSPYKPVDPMMTMFTSSRSSHVTIRFKSHVNIESGLERVERIFKTFNSGYPFEYEFVDTEFSRKFLTEELIGRLTNTFAGLAILISCLGLFGLAAFSAEQRTKEIGIRKVLGASLAGIVALMSKEFLRLILLAALIAFPVAWWAMNNWLAEFPYRINISWWVFALSGIVAFLIALATIGTQAIKAGITNPVKSLKNE